MKKKIYIYEKNEYLIEKLIKCNNGESFFKKVNLFKTKNKDNISIEIDSLVNHYYNIFNKPLNVNEQIENEVNDEIKDIIHENLNSIEIYCSELCAVINKCQSSNFCGNDELCSKMIKNFDEKFIKNNLFFFFKFISHYGVIQNEFNVSHIIPIKKIKKLQLMI
jgi:hypothetical protein